MAYPVIPDVPTGGTSTVPADGALLQGQVAAVQTGQTGTGTTSVERVANKIINVPGTAVTAGTPVPVWTPATGKKFRVMAFHLANSVASAIIMKDGSTEFLRTPLMSAGVGQPSPTLGNGYISTAANNVLNLDVTASGTIHGYIVGIEE